jgi:hypothetical protein
MASVLCVYMTVILLLLYESCDDYESKLVVLVLFDCFLRRELFSGITSSDAYSVIIVRIV